MIELRTFANRQAWVDAAADLLAEAVTDESPLPRGVILPGGSTPKPVFDAVAQRGITAAAAVHIFYSDERMVPPDSPQSNFALSRPLLDALRIPPERVHRVHTELPLEAAAEQLDRELAQFFGAGGSISLGLLGLGADGHTASLFTEADLQRAAECWASPTPRLEPPDRVTLTPKTLSRVQRIVFLTAGDDKADVVRNLVSAPHTVVAGRAIAAASRVEVWFS